MPLIANSLPLNLSTVKTAYGAAGNELRDYIPGGGINDHVITQAGMMASSGTIKLSDFLGSTIVNFGRTAAEPNTNVTVDVYARDQGVGADTDAAIQWYANTSDVTRAGGCIVVADPSGNMIETVNAPIVGNVDTGLGGTWIANMWLKGANAAATQYFDQDLFQHLDFLWNPTVRTINTNGTAGYNSDVTPNTWINFSGKNPRIYAGAYAAGIGTDTTNYKGYFAIRMNASPQTVLCNVYVQLICQARLDP